MKQPVDRSIPVLACSEIGLLHSLGLAGIPVYAGSNYKQNIALYSRYAKGRVHLPDYDTEQFIEALRDFGSRQPEKTVLVTDDDQAVLAFSRHRNELKKSYLFLLPDPVTVETIQDKPRFYKKAKELDLPVPVTFTVSSLNELQSVEDELSFPCILKPVNKEDWWHKDFIQITDLNQKAFRCSSPEELYRLYQKVAPINSRAIVQESIEGPDDQHYSVNMYIDCEGRFRGDYLYQKIRMCPPGAGRGSFFVTVDEPAIMNKARDAARAFEMRGLTNIQFKRDSHTGAVKLIEMEPRLSVSSFLGPAAGANLAVSYYDDLIGENNPSADGYRKEVKYSDFLRDVKAFLQYRKQGELTFWEWVRSYRGNFVCNGYLLKDPCPAFMSFWFMISRRFKKSMEHRV